MSASKTDWLPKQPKADLIAPGLNDAGNAERLISLHGKDLRYSHAMKKWMNWDGHRWKPDTTGRAYLLGKETIQAFLAAAIELDSKAMILFAIKSLDDRRIAHMLASAECDIYVEPEQLDSHPLLLNALNGTIDLATGQLWPHRREDFLTKLVHVNYNPRAKCPRWTKFLQEILDENLLDYLQRALGYSLTGVVIEKAVFVPYGAGNNGKTTLLSTFHELIHEYAAVIQAESLMSRPHATNNITADIADLRGVRFANSSECESGQRLSQSRLKAICQGMGQMKARKLYENPIVFPETHKLWLDTNAKPEIGDVGDDATFNRLHPIPFLKTIPKEQIDPELPEKLKEESEGILAWAVAGAVKWHKNRLGKPTAVEYATQEWRAENGNIGKFIDECCIVGQSSTAAAGKLYETYRQWAEKSGERITASNREFSGRLVRRGFNKRHTNHGERYDGLGLRDQSRGGEG